MKKLTFKNAGNKEKNTPGEYPSIESRKPMISLFKSRTLCFIADTDYFTPLTSIKLDIR